MRIILFLTEEEFHAKCEHSAQNDFFDGALFGFPVEDIVIELIKSLDNNGSALTEKKLIIFTLAMESHRTTDFMSGAWYFKLLEIFTSLRYKNSMSAVAELLRAHGLPPMCKQLRGSISQWDTLPTSQLKSFFDYCEKHGILAHPSRFKLTKRNLLITHHLNGWVFL
ncbi:MAG TPA: hypothetical protein PKC14_01400 [Candidatus Absconditabacterales bacterium]|nr:hypothetical protein [Candidatus Absconditabacterales bacterium]